VTQPRGGFLWRRPWRSPLEFGLPLLLLPVDAIPVEELTFSTINHFAFVC
jgi:hypothetical protein